MISFGDIIGQSRGISLSPCKIKYIQYIDSSGDLYPSFCSRNRIPIYTTMLGSFNPSHFPEIDCIHCHYYRN